MRLHIFDVDFTLVRRSTVREYLARALLEGTVGLSLFWHLPALFVRYRLAGPGPEDSSRAYPFLQGVPQAELERLAEEVFAARILPRIDGAVVARLVQASKEGSLVMIASSSFGTILAPLARHLGVTEVVATELGFEAGLATGRVRGEPAFSEGKRSRILAYLKTKGIEPADCAFYSDSWHDLPLLRAVGKPIAVNPDRILRREALRAGWEILGT